MSETNRPLAVVAILLSLFMAALEATVVATVMPTVVADLGGLELYGWVGAVYMVATTVTIPLYGKLADLYGRKPILYVGMTLFVIGSAASGASRTMTQLIAFRALQGVGAGGVQPVSLTVIGDLFTVEERARIQGIFGAVWGVAAMAGPLVGGLIVKVLSWRWVFYINLPIGVLAASVLAISLHERIERRPHALDVAGAAVLAVAILAVLAAASGIAPLASTALAALGTAGFVLLERRAKEPILPLDLLARPVIAAASIAATLLGGLMTATVIYVPLFVQAILGGTPTEAGTAVAPMLIGWPLASATSGRFMMKLGVRPLVRIGTVFAFCASAAIALFLRPGASHNMVRAMMFLLGVGMGCGNTVLLISVQQAVSWEQRGVATASAMFFRSIGGALAVGILGGVLARALGPEVPEKLVNELLGPGHGRGVDPAVMAPLAGALESGLRSVFAALAGVAAVGVAVGLGFPRVELKGNAERR
jgi:EmrB/QacA subfamily drug resistance transporter